MNGQAAWITFGKKKKKKGNYPLWTVLRVISTRNAIFFFFFETKYKRIESISEQLVSAEMSSSGQASAGVGSWKEKI